MSSKLDILWAGAYPEGMLKSGMSHVVHGIERFLDLLPEPLVLRALAEPRQDLADR